MDPLPPIMRVFSLGVQEEIQRNINSNVSYRVEPAALATEYVSTDNASSEIRVQYLRKSKSMCSHCGKQGHTVDKCYKIHGYAPGYKFNTSQNRKCPCKSGNMQRCYQRTWSSL